MLRLRVFSFFLAGVPLASGALSDGGLARTPRAGESLRTIFEQTMQVELVDHTDALVRDGAETPLEGEPRVRVVKEEHERIAFTDELLEVAEGRATRLRRTFGEISTLSVQRVTRPGAEEQTNSQKGASALEGRSVLFTLEPDRAQYAASFADGREEKGQELLLAGLDEQADLSWFLPPRAVEAGDTWSVDASVFRRCSSPGGELSLVLEGHVPGDEFGKRFHDHLTGRIDARYDGRKEGGEEAPLAIHLAADLSTNFEMEGEPGVSGIHYRFHLLLEGELDWDAAHGRARAIDWEGPVEIRVETRRPIEGLELVTRQRFSGRLRLVQHIE